MIKCIVTWQGINPSGQRINDIFIGNYHQLSSYLQKNNITLTRRKIEYYLLPKHNGLNILIGDLADLLQTGLNLITAFELLLKKYRDPILRISTKKILNDIYAGQSLSSALAAHFNNRCPIDLKLIAIAEQTNRLPQILQQLASQHKFRSIIRKKFYKAMIYPSCILAFTLFITLGLMIFAIPQFESMFNSFNARLPMPTQITLAIAHIILKHGLLILIITISLCMLAWRFIAAKLPFISNLYRTKIIYHWANVFAICIHSGLTVIKGLQLANQTLMHPPIKKQFDHAIVRIKSGLTCHQALSETSLLSDTQLYLIELGESSATLHTMLDRITTQTLNSLQQRLENLSKWLEPVIMMVLAIITGGLIITMYLPIFKIGSIL